MEAPAAVGERALVFIGFMGAGKTTAARAAAAALGARSVDSDHLLEAKIGQPIEDYFAAHGEASFRALEEQVVCELLDHPPGPVISLGGGAASSERVRAALARHTVVLLDVDTATAWQRAGGRRPLARDRARFAALHAERGYHRETNHSGGIEGGMTTGEPLVVRCAMKPLPTLTKPLRSVDIATREPAQALRERTDSCVVPAAGVVGEAMLAFVLAGAYRQKFGGDHIDDVRAALSAYEERIGWKRRRP